MPSGRFSEMHEKGRINYDVLTHLMKNNDYQFKFVLNDSRDLKEVLHIKDTLKIPTEKIYLMAQGTTSAELDSRRYLISQVAKETGMNITDRLHIRLYGNRRAT